MSIRHGTTKSAAEYSLVTVAETYLTPLVADLPLALACSTPRSTVVSVGTGWSYYLSLASHRSSARSICWPCNRLDTFSGSVAGIFSYNNHLFLFKDAVQQVHCHLFQAVDQGATKIFMMLLKTLGTWQLRMLPVLTKISKRLLICHLF